MKKLRATSEEREAFLKALRDVIYMSDYRTPLHELSLDNVVKEFSEIPKDIKKPVLKITVEAYMRMVQLVLTSPVECSWHALAKRDIENNSYLIYDVLVFPQINSATSTTTDEKDFAEWQTKLILDPNFPIEDLRVHGHSHVNMNVFSSGIDDKYQKDLLTKVDNEDYYIFLIMNKKMEICIFIYDFLQQVMFDKTDIRFEIIDSEGRDIRTWALDELEQNAITERYTPKSSFKHSATVFEENEDMSYFSKVQPIFKGGKAYGSK